MARPRKRYVTVAGRVWRLKFCRIKDAWGECDPPGEGAEIRIHVGLPDEKLAETLIHEMLHAADFRLPENIVDQFSRDVARALCDLGYHR